ncbi:MAG: beta-galactosidase [Candidatus Cloacimonetes bacterium]|nr:beta-galactosidase [Candidatus Cloacimonadota bacterium]
MPIIGKVGRKTFKIKALNTFIHLVLLLGAMTMIYPFMIMISASFKSNVDSQSFSVYPQFFIDEKMLYRKYIEGRHNELGDRLVEQYGNRYLSFTLLQPPSAGRKIYSDDWQQFLKEQGKEHNIFDYYISEQFGWGIYPRNERKFRNLMKKETGNDLQKLNEKYGTSTLSWEEVRLEERSITGRNFTGAYSGFLSNYDGFRSHLDYWQRDYISFDGNFAAVELIPEFRNDLKELNAALGTNFNNWSEIKLSRTLPEGALRPYWIDYVTRRCNIHHISFKEEAVVPWQEFLKEKYDSIELLNRTWKAAYESFQEVDFPQTLPHSGALPVDYSFFLETIAQPEWILIKSVEFDYRHWLQRKYGNIRALNQAYEKGFQDFGNVPLPEELPDYNLGEEKTWQDFVRFQADEESIRLKPASQKQFLEFVQQKFGELEELNAAYMTNYKSWINIYPARSIPENSEYRSDWLSFVRQKVDGRFLEIDSSQKQNWQKYLAEIYHNTDNLNQDWHLVWNDFAEVPVDHYQIDHQIFKEHKTSIFWEFVFRNYGMVLDEMLYNGRAIVNTIIYCLLAIITALIVNPLAAYAMSRYKMPATYKIILVLMLTMAFPPMVMGIPNFLLMKRLGMLNTFWALILPGLADGYFIFLLKGFFDSLPKELFESATIDGASEWTIFWRIAMSLSKPIMAVIALNAFNAAYRNFMFAFIVCQDKSMWTMMVNIYQLMQRASAGVGFAALVIASIPTFAVFVFFQNIIIKGIVVPTEK